MRQTMPRILSSCLSVSVGGVVGFGWGRKMRRKILFFPLLATLIFFLYFHLFTLYEEDESTHGSIRIREPEQLENNYFQLKGRKGKRINLPGCTIPVDLDFDLKNNITQNHGGGDELKLKQQLKPCDFVQPSFTFVKGNKIFLNSTFKDASCCYKGVERIFGTDEEVNWTQECVKIPIDGVQVLSYDATVIICEYGGTTFQDYHAIVQEKVKRFKIENPDLNMEPSSPKPSIFIIGIDSVSRTHFKKLMPHTSQLLREMGAFDFEGYVKVGDNTLPNIVPILTGYSLGQISQFCFNTKKPVDSCPFLWHNLSMTTAFLEDAPILNMFNLRKFGFLNQPTDYYLRPLMLAVIKESYSITDNSAFHCVGSRSTESFMLEHIEQLSLLANHPLFLFSWFTSLAHVNPDHLPEADLLFSHHLSRLNLSNTILIVMSDHGYRFGETKFSFNGWYDDKLPFLTIVFPENVKDFLDPAKLQILKENTKKLTTPLDVYHTLVEIMTTFKLGSFTDKNSLNFGSTRVNRLHGQSLFSAVSPNRNCPGAGVPQEYCPCRDLQPISVLDPLITKASDIVLEKINSWLPPRCRKLKILKISAAGKFNEDEFIGGFLTSPGGWQIEMRFRRNNVKNVQYNRISSINHKTEAWCTQDKEMFCYCDILGLVKEYIYGAGA